MMNVHATAREPHLGALQHRVPRHARAWCDGGCNWRISHSQTHDCHWLRLSYVSRMAQLSGWPSAPSLAATAGCPATTADDAAGTGRAGCSWGAAASASPPPSWLPAAPLPPSAMPAAAMPTAAAPWSSAPPTDLP
eukprot:COSAG01_NODE_470_length_16575_cov_5.572408_21_plen_136_part_00